MKVDEGKRKQDNLFLREEDLWEKSLGGYEEAIGKTVLVAAIKGQGQSGRRTPESRSSYAVVIPYTLVLTN